MRAELHFYGPGNIVGLRAKFTYRCETWGTMSRVKLSTFLWVSTNRKPRFRFRPDQTFRGDLQGFSLFEHMVKAQHLQSITFILLF